MAKGKFGNHRLRIPSSSLIISVCPSPGELIYMTTVIGQTLGGAYPFGLSLHSFSSSTHSTSADWYYSSVYLLFMLRQFGCFPMTAKVYSDSTRENAQITKGVFDCFLLKSWHMKSLVFKQMSCMSPFLFSINILPFSKLVTLVWDFVY